MFNNHLNFIKPAIGIVDIMSKFENENKDSTVKVWVAGASGFCGRGTIDALLQETSKYSVLPHIRPSSHRFTKLNEVWKTQGIQSITAEWTDLEPFMKEHTPQVIVSALGTTKKHARTGGGNYQEVDEGLNLSLIEWAQTYCPQAHFIYISAMGVEWGRWNAYLRARMNVETALKQSTLNYTIIRPGLLSGDSRDEKRSLEGMSSILSKGLTKLYLTLGLRKQAYKVRPLDAPEMGLFIKACIDDYYSKKSDGRRQNTYLLKEVYERLEQLDSFTF